MGCRIILTHEVLPVTTSCLSQRRWNGSRHTWLIGLANRFTFVCWPDASVSDADLVRSVDWELSVEAKLS